MRQTGRILISIFLYLMLFLSCDERPPTPAPDEDETILNIGLIPEQNIFQQLERYGSIAKHLSEHLGVKVELKVLPRYGNIIDNFVSLGLDAAFFGSFTYTLAHEKIGVEVIARPETVAGGSSYYGLVFARKDSGIRTAADMKGKVFAFVDQATTAGFIFPLSYFRRNGIDDYHTYLKESYFAGTHEYAIYDVLSGKADVGAAKNTMYEMFSEKDSRIGNDLVILATSRMVPENGLAVRRDLDGAVKERLRHLLLTMHDDPEGTEILKRFGAKRYIPTTTDDYDNVRTLVRDIGLDLKTYDYMND